VPSIDFNDPATHQAEIPAASLITSARSLARMYASFIGEVDGVRLLDDASVATASTVQSEGPDAILIKDSRFGVGFMLDGTEVPFLGPRSFGHDGAGGFLGFADPDANVGFGYVLNRMHAGISADERSQALIRAVRASV
jgi:CubicO group peptidase (beta-lactamase class C family)